MTPAQCRAARALLQWTQRELAERAGVGVSTVADFERGARSPIRSNVRAMRAALVSAGLELSPHDDDGVRRATHPGPHFSDPHYRLDLWRFNGDRLDHVSRLVPDVPRRFGVAGLIGGIVQSMCHDIEGAP